MKNPGFLLRHRSFFLFVFALFAFRWSLADQNLVPSGSMEPTIHVGDRILVNKAAYDLRIPYTEIVLSRTGEPQRGDIVVFMNPKSGMRMVKRLIGVPGDHLVIRNGFVSVNGQPLPGSDEGLRTLMNERTNEVFYHERVGVQDVTIKRTRELFREDSVDLVVPKDQYFMMGDNRDNSFDSRGWGLVPRDHVTGKAVGVLFNLTLGLDAAPTAELDRIGHKL